MGGGLHFLVEIELEMAKMPAFTNLNTNSPFQYAEQVYFAFCDFSFALFLAS